MDAVDLDQRIADLKRRCANLPPDDQERVLDAWAQALTLCELPRDADEPPSILVSLSRPSGLPTNLNP